MKRKNNISSDITNFPLSKKTYKIIIESLRNMKKGKVSRTYNPKELAEISDAAERPPK